MKNKELVKSNSTTISKVASIIELRDKIIGAKQPTQKGDYNFYIRRSRPICYILIVDQSDNTFEESEVICKIVNDFIINNVYLCMRNDGIRDLVYLYLITHHSSEIFTLEYAQISIWKNNFVEAEIKQKEELMPWGESIRSQYTDFKWILPTAQGKPNLTSALKKGYDLAKKHIETFPECAPPIIYNISNYCQKATFEDIDLINCLKQQKSTDGSLLFSNVAIDVNNEKVMKIAAEEEIILGEHASFCPNIILDNFKIERHKDKSLSFIKMNSQNYFIVPKFGTLTILNLNNE